MDILFTLFKFLIVLILIIVIANFVKQYNKKNLQNKLEAERIEKNRKEQERIQLAKAKAKILKDSAIIEGMHQHIMESIKDFQKSISFKDGYFNNNKLINWKAAVTPLYNTLTGYKIKSLKLNAAIFSAIETFHNYYLNGEQIRNQFNLKFIDRELEECNALLSNIEGKPLDLQQRMAVIKDEDNNLVIAGAGSGKTTTVAGKVAYVIDRLKVKPEEILLITFTKKASEEMKHRIRRKMDIDIEVNTFHSFGRKIIGLATQNMPTVIEERQYYVEMKNIFNELFKDAKFADDVIKFITEFRIEDKDENDFKTHGEYIDHIKENNLRSYKTIEVSISGKLTYLREYCKSLEEVKIANYLFLNGINYKYEEPYKYKTSDSIYAQYKPDFYLPDYDIYIEHFGLIDRDNNVPTWFSDAKGLSAKEKYNSEIIWKREKHAEYDTVLLETYSYDNKEGVLLENLKLKLQEKGVSIKKRTSREIWEILNSIAEEEVSALDNLINTFLNLYKSNNGQLNKLTDQISRFDDTNIKSRYSLFLEIFEPIFKRYNDFLKGNNLMDFNDMINDAANYIVDNKFKNNFKYIIIDEFQDTSISRFNLVNALLKNNKACKLFAVGDDWQSIYRFAGSDISLFTDFEKYFGVTEISKIETTYRFSKTMIDISSNFILANPNQTRKELKSFSNEYLEPIEIIETTNFKNEDPFPFINALDKINKENLESEKKLKVLALARYKYNINLYKERRDLFKVNYDRVSQSYIITYLLIPTLEVEFLTVHRSKGLQADYVIILNCVSGKYGFPSEQADDPILNLLLSKADRFKNGEERRLFYVALTRSKNKTFITTNTSYKSKFLNEIDNKNIEALNDKCPTCKEGKIIKNEGVNKYGKQYIRYTCSNWAFGCEYKAWDNYISG